MSELSVAKGSCLCGAVNLSTSSMSPHAAACHCGMCRKWGGGALFAVECGSDVSFEGEENMAIYQSSEWAERGFCQKCGSHLFYRLKQNNGYFIPAGIFEQESSLVLTNGHPQAPSFYGGVRVTHQIFIDEKPKYYDFANKTENMTGEQVIAQYVSPSDQS